MTAPSQMSSGKDRRAAWKEATITAGQIFQNLDGKLRPGGVWRMEVTDEFGHPLYIISVSAKYSHFIHF